MLRGLSLSFCIKDIINGKVDVKNVKEIVTGTCCRTEEDWNKVLDHYIDFYWQADSVRAIDIFSLLKRFGRIDQPRTRGESAPNISEGWWEAL